MPKTWRERHLLKQLPRCKPCRRLKIPMSHEEIFGELVGAIWEINWYHALKCRVMFDKSADHENVSSTQALCDSNLAVDLFREPLVIIVENSHVSPSRSPYSNI